MTVVQFTVVYRVVSQSYYYKSVNSEQHLFLYNMTEVFLSKILIYINDIFFQYYTGLICCRQRSIIIRYFEFFLQF